MIEMTAALMSALEERLTRLSVRDGACLLWTGHLTPAGYGSMKVKGTTVGVHRVAHEVWIGPIPAGLEVDHLCGNRACLEPAHLEAVTHRENLRRSSNWIASEINKSECKRGHTLPEIPGADGFRRCEPCRMRKEPCERCGREIARKNRARHLALSCGGAA